MLKRYIGKCLKESRSSQIRGILTLVLRRLQGNNLSIDEISNELFYYLLKLVFEDVSLTAHIYRLLDFILENTLDSTLLIAALKKKQSKIDAEYPDTIFQIWHYYILFRHSNHEDQINMIATLKDKHFNPLLAACMVLSGKGKNKELYKIIRDAYTQESGSSQWQSEIMNSKWWLPLFKISRYDSHDYDHFMKSNNFPPLLKAFSTHDEEELE